MNWIWFSQPMRSWFSDLSYKNWWNMRHSWMKESKAGNELSHSSCSRDNLLVHFIISNHPSPSTCFSCLSYSSQNLYIHGFICRYTIFISTYSLILHKLQYYKTHMFQTVRARSSPVEVRTPPDCVVSEMFLSLLISKVLQGVWPQDVTHGPVSRWFFESV